MAHLHFRLPVNSSIPLCVLGAVATVSLSSSLEGNANGGGACPGEIVVLTCVVSSDVTTWRIDSLDIDISRNIVPGNVGGTITDEPFEFVGISYNNTHRILTSTATFNASEVADGTEIRCIDGSVTGGMFNSSVLHHVGELLYLAASHCAHAWSYIYTGICFWSVRA